VRRGRADVVAADPELHLVVDRDRIVAAETEIFEADRAVDGRQPDAFRGADLAARASVTRLAGEQHSRSVRAGSHAVAQWVQIQAAAPQLAATMQRYVMRRGAPFLDLVTAFRMRYVSPKPVEYERVRSSVLGYAAARPRCYRGRDAPRGVPHGRGCARRFTGPTPSCRIAQQRGSASSTAAFVTSPDMPRR